MTATSDAGPRDRFRTQNVPWQARLQGAPLASFRARLAAFLIDALLVALVLLVPVWFGRLDVDAANATLSFEFAGLLNAAVAVLYFGLTTYFGNGATLGKRLLGIRVVSLNHERISLWHSIERALGYAASSLEAGFGFLQYFTHPNRQTVHDRIAETIVVVTPRPAKPSARSRP
jgi:uncharacterized RDD family membrane protein YckC